MCPVNAHICSDEHCQRGSTHRFPYLIRKLLESAPLLGLVRVFAGAGGLAWSGRCGLRGVCTACSGLHAVAVGVWWLWFGEELWCD
jgi:hypothetical protein